MVNEAVGRMFGSIAAVTSESQWPIGSQIGTTLRSRGLPKWREIADERINGQVPDDGWLSRYIEELYDGAQGCISIAETPARTLSAPLAKPIRVEQDPGTLSAPPVKPIRVEQDTWTLSAPPVKIIRVEQDPWARGSVLEPASSAVTAMPVEQCTDEKDPWMRGGNASSVPAHDTWTYAGVAASSSSDEPKQPSEPSSLAADSVAPKCMPEMVQETSGAPPTSSWEVFWQSTVSQKHVPQSPGSTPRGVPEPCEMAVNKMKSEYAKTPCRGKQAQIMTARQADGTWKDPEEGAHERDGEGRQPKWVMDIVAMFLMAFHVSIKPYCRERCSLRTDRKYAPGKERKSLPKTYYDPQEFIVNNHAKTLKSILRSRADSSTTPDWETDQDVLSVGVMRQIATDMLSKFLWRQAWSRAEYRYVWKQPVGAWDWDNMWLDEYEVETIATMVMRGYLSAGVSEIQEAAAALKLKRK